MIAWLTLPVNHFKQCFSMIYIIFNHIDIQNDLNHIKKSFEYDSILNTSYDIIHTSTLDII